MYRITDENERTAGQFTFTSRTIYTGDDKLRVHQFDKLNEFVFTPYSQRNDDPRTFVGETTIGQWKLKSLKTNQK